MWDREAGSNMWHRDLYSSPNATSIRMIKYRSMNWEGYVLRISETRSTCIFFGGEGGLDMKEATTGKN